MKKVIPLIWKDRKLSLIDQRILPLEEKYIDIRSLEEVHRAIKDMVVRGAPLIGFTALYGLVVHLQKNLPSSINEIKKACEYLKTARPTAVNLAFELDQAIELAHNYLEKNGSLNEFLSALEEFSTKQIEDIHYKNLAMANFAANDLKEKFGEKKLRLMTLCNTGALACGPMGTALGVIEYMNTLGRIEHVYASETRPYLQGSRLTAYELSVLDIEHSITVEGAFSYLLKNKLVDAVFIGSDRIAANGDAANKIGSSTLAITCKYYGVPFYVVAPLSTFDFKASSGEDIEIELRGEEEILKLKNIQIAPESSRALNPSFDVTDHKLIEAIICERALIKNPSTQNLNEAIYG